MFCPSCGMEERQRSQFCRVCGTNLGTVRTGLERTDAITASAVTARDEIGRAIAARIKELRTAKDLSKVAEEVLPEVEKFLESPEERRLRRLRAGVITASIGLGAALFFLTVILLGKGNVFPMLGAGIVTFLIGMGLILNGLLFSLPAKAVPHYLPDARLPVLPARSPEGSVIAWPAGAEKIEVPSASALAPPSVTEHTTHQLAKEPVVVPKPRSTRE